eukprot:TRINITY_DN1240_c0_g3_i2.p1 TRINITY_DN1240_c0_g3~~TRINITY_DN1240_c0_g3_i2.p1  ORF type:complete len:496 (-),score=168.91 TRINITY_DN1240_c0_g3_i2:34-1521(-)
MSQIEGIPDFEDSIAFEDLILEDEIGKGAFGVVMKANYFGTMVAVKQVTNQNKDEENMKYFHREIALLKGLRHPNIVQFIGITKKDDNIHIVTEYVPGGNLRSWLKREEIPLPWSLRILWANDVASALAFLHAKQVLFRDLKSKNVLIHEQKAKICDFGLARGRDTKTEQAAPVSNRPLTLCGTDEWMAPEVILGMDYDSKADVFSYGMVLFEIISRKKVSTHLQRLPKDAFGLDEEKAKQLIPNDCPSELSKLAFQCTEYEPETRPVVKTLLPIFSAMIKQFPYDANSLQLPQATPSGQLSPRSNSNSSVSSTPKSAAKPAASPVPSPTPSPTASANKLAPPTPFSSSAKSSGSSTKPNAGSERSGSNVSQPSSSFQRSATAATPKANSASASNLKLNTSESRTGSLPKTLNGPPSPTKKTSLPHSVSQKPPTFGTVSAPRSLKPGSGISKPEDKTPSSTSQQEDEGWAKKPVDGTVLKPSELRALAKKAAEKK